MLGKQLLAILLTVIIYGCILTSPAVQAQSTSPGTTRDPLSLYINAGANPQQISKIKSIIQGFMNEQDQKAQALWELIHDMHDLSFQPAPSLSVVMAKQDQINKSSAEMANAKVKLMLQIRDVLTLPQKQRLVQIMRQASAAQAAAAPSGGTSSSGKP